MSTEEVEPPHKEEETEPQALTLLSLPEEILENILARISKWNYPNLSLVSKRFLSLLSSPQIYTTRSNIGTTEPCLYFCLELSKNRSPEWYTLWMKPPETLTDDDDISEEYSLVPVPCYLDPHCVPYDSTIAVGSEIYVIGAPYKSPPTSAVRIFDCRTNTWRDGPNMMVARENPNAVFVDGKLYVLGGCEKDESMAHWMEVLDINTQTWSFFSSYGADELRNSDSWFTINALEGKIYAMADRKDYAYDPKKGKWEVIETHLSNIWIDDWCVIDNVMYYCTNSGYCMWYDSKSRQWEEVKGSDLELLRTFNLACGVFLKLLNHSGKLLVVSAHSFEEYNRKWKRRIWCAKIALEKRNGGEIWGKIEWANSVLTVSKSYRLLSCVAISI
ncbi:PREDICTED: F-box/kelch-repeat protein At5g39560-like [Camelina sativa]|uniref:F-box/kelch-repeat protein At5g39560-like n=1 Tax=Camelina sativa TaxID=90675 RepID=A0ABM0V5L2_CAMSA|nr:PREDICTED: F-box/kelch-repeat protein At5g39560-like [Camelina sativa]